MIARTLSHDHQAADDAEQRHVGEADREIELAERAQHGEQPDAGRGADNAAGQQHQREREIERAPPPVGDRAGERRGGDVARDARHRDRGGMPMKISSGVIRKPPPMPNMPEMKPTASPIAEDEEDIDRQVGDRKVDLHETGSAGARASALSFGPQMRDRRERTLVGFAQPSRTTIRQVG